MIAVCCPLFGADIPSWNGAVILPTRAIAQALAAGCSIVLKASEKCPALHQALVRTFEDAGLPVGVVNQIQVRREDAAAVTETLVAHPAIRKVEFIGSAGVGRSIAELGARYLKPVVLELGGKSPAVVLEDADLSQAAVGCCAGGELRSSPPPPPSFTFCLML